MSVLLEKQNDPTDRVAVLFGDLEQWQEALRWAHSLSTSLDLSDAYRAGRPNMASSKLTLTCARAHDRIGGYLNVVSEPQPLSSDE